MKEVKISIPKDFSVCPGGRYKDDGPNSAESLRETILVPAIQTNDSVNVDLDGVMGYPASFLEEAFGGLTRNGFSPEHLLKILHLNSEDEELKEEIISYIKGK